MIKFTRQKLPPILIIFFFGQLFSLASHAADALRVESECYQSIYRNFSIGKGPLLPEMEAVMGTIAIINPRSLPVLASDRNSKGVFVFTKDAGYFIDYPRKADSSYVPFVNSIMQNNRFKLENVDYINSQGNHVTNTLYLIIDAKSDRNSPSDPYGLPTLFRAGAIEATSYHQELSFSELPKPVPESEAHEAFTLELRRELDRLHTSFSTAPTDGKDVTHYQQSLEKCLPVAGLKNYVQGELDRIAKAPKAPASKAEKTREPKTAEPAGEAKPMDQKSN